MLTVLFSVSYQSIHTFSHEHERNTFYDVESKNQILKTSEGNYTQSNDCPACDFEFAAFLSPEVLHFDFIPSFYEIPYQFNSNETCITFEGNSFYLRGPPALV